MFPVHCLWSIGHRLLQFGCKEMSLSEQVISALYCPVATSSKVEQMLGRYTERSGLYTRCNTKDSTEEDSQPADTSGRMATTPFRRREKQRRMRLRKVPATSPRNQSGECDGNVVLILRDESGMVVATTLTDSDGNYVFADVPSGTYTVTETNVANYVDVSDSDGANDSTISVILGAGTNSTGNMFVDEVFSAASSATPSVSGARPRNEQVTNQFEILDRKSRATPKHIRDNTRRLLYLPKLAKKCVEQQVSRQFFDAGMRAHCVQRMYSADDNADLKSYVVRGMVCWCVCVPMRDGVGMIGGLTYSYFASSLFDGCQRISVVR